MEPLILMPITDPEDIKNHATVLDSRGDIVMRLPGKPASHTGRPPLPYRMSAQVLNRLDGQKGLSTSERVICVVQCIRSVLVVPSHGVYVDLCPYATLR